MSENIYIYRERERVCSKERCFWIMGLGVCCMACQMTGFREHAAGESVCAEDTGLSLGVSLSPGAFLDQ